jgi:hypothetical protein
MSSTGVYQSWLGSGTALTSAGLTSGFMGNAALTGSNTTITNSNVKATSIILITPIATNTGTNMPVIYTTQAGSFNVLVSLAGGGRPDSINYLICS